MISRIMANYIRPFRMLLLGTLCLFCLDTFAQNTVVKRQPVSKKVTKKKKMVKKKVKVEEVQSTTQAVQQFEMPTVVDCCQLQSAPSEYNCPNEDVRKEDVVTVGGQNLHSFSVVVGNFAVKSNAIGMYLALQNKGFQPSIAYSNTSNLYRVILGTSDSLRDAIYCKEKYNSLYPGSWLLYKEY